MQRARALDSGNVGDSPIREWRNEKWANRHAQGIKPNAIGSSTVNNQNLNKAFEQETESMMKNIIPWLESTTGRWAGIDGSPPRDDRWSLLREGILKFVYVNQGVGRFAKLGMPFPMFTADFVGGLEIVGGVLLMAGLLTR